MTPIKDPAESIVLEFDFSSEMTAIGSAAVSIAVVSGVDAAASGMIVGAAQISGAKVLQRIGNGVAGVDYKLRCQATSGSDVLVRADVMPVRTA